MKPRDPTQLARIAPDAGALTCTLDAFHALLEEVESLGALDVPLGVIKAAAHARAWWDKLTTQDSPEEVEARERIDEFKASNGTPADVTKTRGGMR